MRSRKEILEDLILLKGDVNSLIKELAQYPWDAPIPLLVITPKDVESILQRCISNDFDLMTLENWANAIECRDDLDYSSDELHELIFELANPEINGEITKDRLADMIKKLSEMVKP